MRNPDKKKLREFGFTITIGIPLIFGFLIPTLLGHDFRLWTIFVGLVSLLLSIFSPIRLFYFYKFWISIGYVLGWFNSRIILGLVFFSVLIPISFIMKLFGHDPLRTKKSKENSYREKKSNSAIDLTKTALALLPSNFPTIPAASSWSIILPALL